MDHLYVILQGVFGLFLLTLPGAAILGRASKRRFCGWPPALQLAAAFVVSSLALSAWQAASLRWLGPTASRWAAWALVALLAVWGMKEGRRVLGDAWRSMGRWERWAVAGIAAVVLFWLAAMPLSPYPSHFSMKLGDPPVYFRAAENLVSGKGWEPDYLVADYPGGKLGYVESHPVPVLITTIFFQVFGNNWDSLYVYNALCGAVLLWLLVAVAQGTQWQLRGGGDPLFLALLVVLLPAHFIMFGLGVISAPGALAFLTAVTFVVLADISPGWRAFGVVASLGLMVGVRPEAALLAALLAVVLGLWLLFAHLLTTWRARILGGLACLGLLAAAWWSVPWVMERRPTVWQSLGVFYLRYDLPSGRFVPLYEPWWELNRRMCRVILNGEDPIERLGNPAAGVALRAHPVAFLRFLAGQLSVLAWHLVDGITLASYRAPRFAGVMSLCVLAGLVLLASMNRRGAPFAVAVLAFLLVLPAVNMAAHVRHVMTASPALLALALRSAWRGWGHWVRRAAASRVFVAIWAVAALGLAGYNGWRMVLTRTHWTNCTYVPILRDLERLAGPDDVIASSYPQLITCMTGRRSVGGTWVVENLDAIIRRFRPALILVDNARDGCRNYDELAEAGGRIPGYAMLVHNRQHQYAIFRALPAAGTQ